MIGKKCLLPYQVLVCDEHSGGKEFLDLTLQTVPVNVISDIGKTKL